MNPACIGLEVLVLGARLCLGEPAPVTQRVCPIVETWPAGEQRRFANEIRALPPGSASEAAAAQLIRLRDQARACAKP